MANRIFLLIFILTGMYKVAMAANDSTRKELMMLVKTRAEMFQSYTNSLNKKSGFFGNRTKNDLRATQDQLKQIVDQDNKIIDALNRTLDYRTFEKSSMNYDVNEYLYRIRNLTVINDTLSRQVDVLRAENKLHKSASGRYRFYNTALLLISLVLGLSLFRKTRKHEEKLSK